MIYTTLNKIRAQHPCKEEWEKLLKSLGKTEADDDQLSLSYILKSNGIDGAILALSSVEGRDKEILLFACACAKRVLPIYEAAYPNDNRVRNAIDVAVRYANGKSTEEELHYAWAAAESAVRAVAWVTARTAWAAADSATSDAERKAQEKLFVKFFG